MFYFFNKLNVGYERLSERSRLFRLIFFLLLTLGSLFLIIIRRPDAILNPQFWAEDGVLWFGQAYSSGWVNALFLPVTGYFQTLARIGGSIAQLFPLGSAPLIFNLIAILTQMLPIYLFIYSSIKKVFPHIATRLFLVVAYLLLANISEVYINLTNAQWFLALSSVLTLLFTEGQSNFYLKSGLFLLSGLSGPFSLFLFPLSLLRFSKTFKRKEVLIICIIGITAIIQLVTLFSQSGRESSIAVDASPALLFGIFYKQIVLGSLIGPIGYQWATERIINSLVIFQIAGILALALIVYVLWKGSKELRLLALFGLSIFASSLLFPILGAERNDAPWLFLFREWGTRYWLIPSVTFLVSVLWTATKTRIKWPIRAIGIIFLSIMMLFQAKNYRHYNNFQFQERTDLRFQKYALEFSKLKPGQRITIPINPPEERWRLTLFKK